jgi:prophage regulatory protein
MEHYPKHSVLLSRSDLRKLGITFSGVHLLRLEKAGRFPLRLRLGAYRRAWLMTEIIEWIEQRAAERALEKNDDL